MEDSYRDVLDAQTPLKYLRAEVTYLRSLDDTSGDAEMMEKAADEIDSHRKTLEEVRTNGQWSKGEGQGDWIVSKGVYQMVCDELSRIE